ncbi:hypothetical protein PHMEG_0005871 [Phytophthora megakarya]|uniref:Uncharacterized protein n=1 Tax=Phytophthora megakarya TaxID=4795 RepID=A0A225WQC7_9STRA|nr:hypothetical protein PHMEG_0005871 [Phytophthora megakarya]
MARDIRSYCATCKMCMRTKPSRSKTQGLLHPLDVPEGRWKHITMDVVMSLPETKPHRHNAVMVIVNRLTKGITASRLNQQPQRRPQRSFSGITFNVFMDFQCLLYSKFTSKFWAKLLDLQDTKLKPSYAFKS